jgi:hypothetical protein
MAAVTTITRDRALDTLRDGHSRVMSALGGVTDDDLVRRGTIGDGDWSGKDLIGHLTCWEELALEAVDARRAGRTPWVVATPKDADGINADAIVERADRALERIRSEAEDVHGRLCATIDAMSDDEWLAPAAVERGREQQLWALLGGILGAPRRRFGHSFAHLNDAEAFARGVREGG